MASESRSKHAFGAEANIDAALAAGTIDAYDVLFLNEGKIGWIDRDGNKVIPEYVIHINEAELPESGKTGVLYIFNDEFYIWNGTEFVMKSGGGTVTETVVDEKLNVAKAEVTESANAYTDEQIAEAIAIVEF